MYTGVCACPNTVRRPSALLCSACRLALLLSTLFLPSLTFAAFVLVLFVDVIGSALSHGDAFARTTHLSALYQENMLVVYALTLITQVGWVGLGWALTSQWEGGRDVGPGWGRALQHARAYTHPTTRQAVTRD